MSIRCQGLRRKPRLRAGQGEVRVHEGLRVRASTSTRSAGGLSAAARAMSAAVAVATMRQSPVALPIGRSRSRMLEALPVLNTRIERLQRHHSGIDRRIRSKARVRHVAGGVDVPEVRMLVRDVGRVDG
jgi:hypothetical protein